jgi:guanine deaminase
MEYNIYKSHILNPISENIVEIFNPGYLVIKDGKIIELSSDDVSRDHPNAQFIDLKNRLIIPGLVDTHLHLPQFSLLGTGSGELLKWLKTYVFPEEEKFANPKYAERISKLFFNELTANGTTTASIYATIHEKATDLAFSTAAKTGIRALMGKVMMDQNCPSKLQEDISSSIESSERLIEKWNDYDKGRLKYVLTPRFAPTCSRELMKEIGKLANKKNIRIQSHLSENKNEISRVKELFPESESYTGLYDSFDLLGERTIMAHCIYLSSDELDKLQKTNTKVAHCPYSNRFLESGVMPYYPLKDAGLKISLGSDIAGGPSISMFRQMGEAIMASKDALRIYEKTKYRVMSSIEAFYLATLGGAKVLGLDKEIGNLEPGKEADFLILETSYSDPLRGENAYNDAETILSRLIFNAGKESVENVHVRGKLIHQKTL